MKSWPIFTETGGGRLAINPALVSAVYESKSTGKAEIYTLDCSKQDDAWEVEEPFDEVVAELGK